MSTISVTSITGTTSATGSAFTAINANITASFAQANTVNTAMIASFAQANAAYARANVANALANVAIANNMTFTGLTISATRAYMNVVSVTDGATITLDLNQGNNFNVTLGGARTLANPTNTTIGQSGIIFISQNTSGGSTLAYGNAWRFSNNTAPTLTSAASSIDALTYVVRASGSIFTQITYNVG